MLWLPRAGGREEGERPPMKAPHMLLPSEGLGAGAVSRLFPLLGDSSAGSLVSLLVLTKSKKGE